VAKAVNPGQSQGQKAAKLVQAFFKPLYPSSPSQASQRLPDARHRPSTSNSRLSGRYQSGRLHRSHPMYKGLAQLVGMKNSRSQTIAEQF